MGLPGALAKSAHDKKKYGLKIEVGIISSLPES
jgi:hypothetical protein